MLNSENASRLPHAASDWGPPGHSGGPMLDPNQQTWWWGAFTHFQKACTAQWPGGTRPSCPGHGYVYVIAHTDDN